MSLCTLRLDSPIVDTFPTAKTAESAVWVLYCFDSSLQFVMNVDNITRLYFPLS